MTKPLFKVGDRVKVVSAYAPQFYKEEIGKKYKIIYVIGEEGNDFWYNLNDKKGWEYMEKDLRKDCKTFKEILEN